MDGGREGRGEKRETVWEGEVEVGKEGEKEREKEGWMGERKKWGEVRMDGEGGARKERRKEGMRKKRIGTKEGGIKGCRCKSNEVLLQHVLSRVSPAVPILMHPRVPPFPGPRLG